MKNLVLVFILTANLFGFESFNYVNKNYKVTSSTELKANYFPTISPYYYSKKIQYFKSFDSLNIAYKIFEVKDAKATIVISSGRTEGMLKYQELIYDLNRNGYTVYIHDHRGQGNSDRLLSDSQIGHVVEFKNYVLDMHQFVREIVKKEKKLILIGHSMGGAIASLYVEEYPNDFDALVLSSPMHQPYVISSSIADLMCNLIEKRHDNIDRYIVGGKSYDDNNVAFRDNMLTHSKVRYKMSKIAFDIEPNTKIGAPSVRWIQQACLGSAKSVQNASKIRIPILLIHAQNDKIVNIEAQEEFCNNASIYCKGIQIDGAYHELFVEEDYIREKALTAILDFISKI